MPSRNAGTAKNAEDGRAWEKSRAGTIVIPSSLRTAAGELDVDT